MRRLAMILVAAAALLAAAPASAQHEVFFFCEIAPFSYHVDSSSYLAHNGRYQYAANGTTMLLGPDCPMHGQTVGIHEGGLVFGIFPFTTVATGSWNARVDINHDGVGDVGFQGQVTLFATGIGNTWQQFAGGEAGIAEMGLNQLAEIDFTMPHHHGPLLDLETIEGAVAGFFGHH
jgi:hypothetical protein